MLDVRKAIEMVHGNDEQRDSVLRQELNDMTAKLEKEAEENATEKVYCDEEVAKAEAKKSDLEDTVAKLTLRK